MKEKKNLGLLVMAFAMVMGLSFGVKLDASASNTVGYEFYNEDNANGEEGQQVKYIVTKVATSSKAGECKAIDCKSDATSIKVAGIPKYDGYEYTCTEIAAGAFKNSKSLKTAVINSAVDITAIPANCFYGCTKLKTVEILPTEIETIGSKAFYNCKKLTTIKIASKELSKSDIKTNAFKNVKSVEVLAPTTKLAKNYAKWIKARGAKATSYDTF